MARPHSPDPDLLDFRRETTFRLIPCRFNEVASERCDHRSRCDPHLMAVRRKSLGQAEREESLREDVLAGTPSARPSARRRSRSRSDFADRRRDLFDACDAHQSGNSITLQRPGVSRPSCSCKVIPSFVTKTRSPRAAPIRSNARTGSPSGLPSTPSSWTISSRSPWKDGCLIVEVADPTTRLSCIDRSSPRYPPNSSNESHAP